MPSLHRITFRSAWVKSSPGRTLARATLIVMALMLAACSLDPAPSNTPTVPSLPQAEVTIAASPTVDPVLPESDSDNGLSIGASNPTQARLAAEGEPVVPGPTSTPQATQATLPMMISASDGLVLQATYYGPERHPAPGVLLVHMASSDRSAWEPLAESLQQQGYAVLAIDLRGHGSTGGQVNWELSQGDVTSALAMLRDLPGVDPQRIAVVGASIGANLGLNACASAAECQTAVLLSPGLDYRGITASNGIARLGSRPVLIATSENDDNNPGDSLTLDGMVSGPHRLLLYPDAGHGTDMLVAQPNLIAEIAGWLNQVMPVQAGS